MVDRDDISELISKARDLDSKLNHHTDVKANKGKDITVIHPITGNEIQAGEVTQQDVNAAHEDAQEAANELKAYIDTLDFTTVE